MSAAKQFDGKVAVVTGGTQGLGEAIARLFAARGAKGIVICGRNAEQRQARSRRDLDQGGLPRPNTSQADLADLGADPRRDGGGRQGVRPRRHAGERRRHHGPRHGVRHLARIVRAHDGGQPARAVLPAAGCRHDHAAREDRGHGGQHPVDVGAWRPAVPHALQRVEGRARDAHQERRLRADAVAHPRQRTQSRLDEYAGRGSHHEARTTARKDGWLEKADGRAAVRPADRSERGGARGRVPGERRSPE